MRWPPAQDARRLAGGVAQPPVVVVRDRLLQDALGGEVKRRRATAGRVNPVDGTLPMRILRQQRAPRLRQVPANT